MGACLDPFPNYDDYLIDDASVRGADTAVVIQACDAEPAFNLGAPCAIPGVDDICGVWSCDEGTRTCLSSADSRALPDAVESCNFEDDDCDGLSDEDFVQLGEDCDLTFNGAPAFGRLTCAPNVSEEGNPYFCDCCDPQSPDCFEEAGCRPKAPDCNPVPEACNGEDDDCDSRVDEGPFEPCLAELDSGCNVNGVLSCGNAESVCVPEDPRLEGCACIESVIDGGTHYISCAMPYTWLEASDFCEGLRATYSPGISALQSGRLLEIETRSELNELTSVLYSQQFSSLRTWLNTRYDGRAGNTDFDNWYDAAFPPQRFQNFDEEPNVDDEDEVCLYLQNEPFFEWRFDACEMPDIGLVCEFCPNAGRDDDNDGHFACLTDCDDNKRQVHWGAAELCHNRIDDNCDGVIDENCPCQLREVDQRFYLFCANNGDRISWNNALEICRVRQMQLAVFETETEFYQVASLAQQIRNNEEFWIGLHQPSRGPNNERREDDAARPWVWTQTNAVYPRDGDWWLGGNGNNHDQSNRDCAYMRKNGNQTPYLRAEDCGRQHSFICEGSIQTP